MFWESNVSRKFYAFVSLRTHLLASTGRICAIAPLLEATHVSRNSPRRGHAKPAVTWGIRLPMLPGIL